MLYKPLIAHTATLICVLAVFVGLLLTFWGVWAVASMVMGGA